MRVRVSPPTEGDDIPNNFPDLRLPPSGDPVCDYKPHSDADCTVTVDGGPWEGWINHFVNHSGQAVPGRAQQEWVRFEATAGETYTVDVRGFNKVYRVVQFSGPPIPYWYAGRDHLDFPYLNYSQPPNTLTWSQTPYFSCQRELDQGDSLGSTSTRPKIMGIFNDDGEKVKGGKTACASPGCKARVRVTAAETGPLFVAVRFVGWHWMFRDYTVEVNKN